MKRFQSYYAVRRFIPRNVQILLRQRVVQFQRQYHRKIWPIDKEAACTPPLWQGWPDDKRFAVILSHDVETKRGYTHCRQLMQLEEKLGFRSSFNFVPERYEVATDLVQNIKDRGFEVCVHGLKHDGRLYESREIFSERAKIINGYLKKWDAVGFHSPSMHHNLDWIGDLQVEYDASTFDTDPFEPQSDGVKTIFPFWVDRKSKGQGYVELPYTLCQDFTLFVLMNQGNIDIWKQKLDWIVKHGGMVLVNTHPDYMAFNEKEMKLGRYPVQFYEALLTYIKNMYKDEYWHVLPKDLASQFKNQVSAEMSLSAKLPTENDFCENDVWTPDANDKKFISKNVTQNGVLYAGRLSNQARPS